ncbi:acylphosphatase [uncultured Thiodictyon sp.]|uniref:acylphosphatase n=1 Tax=uncultured Thiodictyon sp. TaxID=1846217 RepID=UPI0025EC45D2|nr:acylphosphatase [uncultured Thiodictyon sp.]
MADARPDVVENEAPPVCCRCLVEGRVQGVYFRGATREQAVRLGVTGYARNLPDGRVEVLACGPPDAVAQLRYWLRSGPPMARVAAVNCEPRDYQSWSGFSVD